MFQTQLKEKSLKLNLSVKGNSISITLPFILVVYPRLYQYVQSFANFNKLFADNYNDTIREFATDDTQSVENRCTEHEIKHFVFPKSTIHQLLWCSFIHFSILRAHQQFHVYRAGKGGVTIQNHNRHVFCLLFYDFFFFQERKKPIN